MAVMVENSQFAGLVLTSVFGLTLLALLLWKHFKYPPGKKGKPDPVALADVYVAYGQRKRAIEILEKALITHPDRREELDSKLSSLRVKQ
jgi:hypothetical protein